MSSTNGGNEQLLALPALPEIESNFLKEMEGSLLARKDQLDAHRGTLAQTLELVDKELVKLNRMLRVINPPPPEASANGSKKRSGTNNGGGSLNSTGFGISIERAIEGANQIRKIVSMGKQTFTQREVYAALNWDQSKGSALFRYLRSIEFIRKAGQADDTSREIWAILDEQAIDRAEADYRAALKDRQPKKKSRRSRISHEEAMQRVLAYLQECGTVRGWVTIQKECNLSKATMQRCNEELQQKKLVRVSGENNARREIEWIGEK